MVVVAIFLVASCYRNRDNTRLCGPFVSCADFFRLMHFQLRLKSSGRKIAS